MGSWARLRSISTIAFVVGTLIAVEMVDPIVSVDASTDQPGLVSLVPARLLETRVGSDLRTVDREFEGIGRRGAGSVLALPVLGRGGVPLDAEAVVVNVTAVFPLAAGFVTVFPCGSPRPGTSNVNYQVGDVSPNAVVAKVGVGGAICIFTLAPSDLIVDVTAYVPAGGSLGTLVPARLLETRVGSDLRTVDREFEGIGRRGAGSVLALPVLGRGGVPLDAEAVVVNVTAVFPLAAGFVTVFPCGSPRPGTSNVNYQVGDVSPNAVVAKVGVGGAICIFTLAPSDLIVDVTAYVPAGGSLGTLVPARLLETRVGSDLRTVDREFEGIGRRGAGSVLALPVLGRGGVPLDAEAVVVNVTAVFPLAAGFVTVFPCGSPRPGTSNVNYQVGDVSPNAVVAKVGVGGAICIFTLAPSDLIVDVTAYVPSTAVPESDEPSLSGISTDHVEIRLWKRPRVTLTGSHLDDVDLLLLDGPKLIGVRPSRFFDVTETSLTFELNHNCEPGTYSLRAAVWDEQFQANRAVGGTVSLTIEIEPVPAHNRFLAVYAVPTGQPIETTRPDLISDTIEAVQAWFDDETRGVHPRVYESGGGVEVLTVEVDGALGAGESLSDFTSALRDRLPGDYWSAPLLIFGDWAGSSALHCGTTTNSDGYAPATIAFLGSCNQADSADVREHQLARQIVPALGYSGRTSEPDDLLFEESVLGTPLADVVLDVGHDDYYDLVVGHELLGTD